MITVISIIVIMALTPPASNQNNKTNITLSDAMNIPDSAEFKKVSGKRTFTFPEDHGPHPGYAIEWWYFTGNLDNASGDHFGYELTIFRIGLSNNTQERNTDWMTSGIYMAHFAVTDVNNEMFYSFERFSRDSLQLAGALIEDSGDFRIWLEDWTITGSGDAMPVINLKAKNDVIAIDLLLESIKPLVLQGDQGYSKKGNQAENASYYYSVPRMETSGTINIENISHVVNGDSWMDREWSSSALGNNQIGWNWFAFQFDNNHELMYYQMLSDGPAMDLNSHGVIVDPSSGKAPINHKDITLQAMEHWRSPSGISYPIRWKMLLPSESIDLDIRAYIPNQELDVSIKYWEGNVDITGMFRGESISGSGYVEMTR